MVIPETCWEQKCTDVYEYKVDIFVMGDDWSGKFDFLNKQTNVCMRGGVEVIYLPRTPEISSTQIKEQLRYNKDEDSKL